MLTSGDALNAELLKPIDQIADYLKQLQNKGIAVLWRPYHEMNGAWFWWGKQTRLEDLWIQMWERFQAKGVNNVPWVFSVNFWEDSWGANIGPSGYYPGPDYVDVVGVDVYVDAGHKYDKRVHDALSTFGGGKPLAITENGQMPDVGTFKSAQPNFVYWATWWGFEKSDKGNTDALYTSNYSDAATITQDEVSVPACN